MAQNCTPQLSLDCSSSTQWLRFLLRWLHQLFIAPTEDTDEIEFNELLLRPTSSVSRWSGIRKQWRCCVLRLRLPRWNQLVFVSASAPLLLALVSVPVVLLNQQSEDPSFSWTTTTLVESYLFSHQFQPGFMIGQKNLGTHVILNVGWHRKTKKGSVSLFRF